MVYQSHGGIRFGSSEGLTLETMADLQRTLAHIQRRKDRPLDGRGGNHTAEISDLGPVFVKHYLRGGWLSVVNNKQHLRSARCRAQREFETLTTIRGHDIPTPQPLAWAESGHLLVQCWLIMREETASAPFTQLLRTDPATAHDHLPAIAKLVAQLIRHRFLHVDLHPGNVLIANNQSPMLIDFDKSYPCKLNESDLTARYLKRWNRAVHKYALPAFLTDDFATELKAVLSEPAADPTGRAEVSPTGPS